MESNSIPILASTPPITSCKIIQPFTSGHEDRSRPRIDNWILESQIRALLTWWQCLRFISVRNHILPEVKIWKEIEVRLMRQIFWHFFVKTLTILENILCMQVIVENLVSFTLKGVAKHNVLLFKFLVFRPCKNTINHFVWTLCLDPWIVVGWLVGQ